MQISSYSVGPATVVTFDRGILGGLGDIQRFGETFRALAEDGRLKIVLDLSNFRYINSIGLGMIIGGYTSLKNRSGDFVIAGPNERVSMVLAVAKLDRVIQVFEGIEDAVAALGATRQELEASAGSADSES